MLKSAENWMAGFFGLEWYIILPTYSAVLEADYRQDEQCHH